MSTPTKMDYHHSTQGIHFSRANEEFLTLLYSGEIVIRSRASDGSRHIHVGQWPKLLPWILAQLCSKSGDFWVGIHPLPDKTHKRVRIRSVVTLFVVNADEFPIVLTREPLDSRGVNELIQRLPPFLALLNAGEVYLNPVAPYARPQLA